MLASVLLTVIETVCGFFSFVLLARFALQWARAPFRNPLGRFVAAVSDWMVLPARRLIPGLFGVDMASLLLAWLWQAVYLGLALGLTGALLAVTPAALVGVALLAVLETARIALQLTLMVVIVSAIFSWVSPYAPLAEVFNTLTRPLLRPFQRFIPLVGGIDLSPLAVLLLIQVAQSLLAGLRPYLLPILHG